MIPEHEVTPRRLFEELQERVVGQKDALRAISKVLGYAAWRHRKLDEGFDPNLLPKGLHALLVGPSGTGKTYSVETAAELTGRPFVAISATRLTQEGYIGLKLHDVLLQVLQKAGGNIKLAQRAVIFIDELDKIPKHDCTNGPDVNGAGVQFELLRVLQGTVETLGIHKDKGTFDTSEQTFVFAGVFEGMKEDVDPNVLPVEEFVRLGMDRQLIERIATRVRLNPLTSEDRRRLLLEIERSPLKRLNNALQIEGVDLQMESGAEDEILDLLAEDASARALEALVADRLGTILFELPEYKDKGIRRIRVDKDTVLRRFHPFKVPGDAFESDLEALKTSSTKPRLKIKNGLTDTSGWSVDDVLALYHEVKAGVDYDSASEQARAWWNVLEEWAGQDPLPGFAQLLRFAEELLTRGATVEEAFNARSKCRCNSSRACLHYLDYLRILENEYTQPPSKDSVRSGEKCTQVLAGHYQFAGYHVKADRFPVDEDNVYIEVGAGDVFPFMNDRPCWWLPIPY